MSKPILGEPNYDWQKVFKCPKCEGRLQLRDQEMVCEKCGYRKPLEEDFTKPLPVMYG
jgi:hypothetical protein